MYVGKCMCVFVCVCRCVRIRVCVCVSVYKLQFRLKRFFGCSPFTYIMRSLCVCVYAIINYRLLQMFSLHTYCIYVYIELYMS